MTDQHLSATRRQLIIDVSRQGLVFGEKSAAFVGVDALEDPNVQVYYLLYVLGAIEYFGEQLGDAEPLSDGEKLAAMAEALAAFDASSNEEIRQTVLALNTANSPAAASMRALGSTMAAQAQTDDSDSALRKFASLLADRATHLPLPLEDALAAIAGPGAPG
ncbi:MAG: hypothetical protein AB8G17_18155 [Gammaproteobacteria bacterium]